MIGLKVKVLDDVSGVEGIEHLRGRTFNVDKVDHKKNGTRLYSIFTDGARYKLYSHEVDLIVVDDEESESAIENYEQNFGTW